MKLSSNVACDFNVDNNFLHKLLLNNKQVPKLRKPLTNNSSANIELLKTKFHKIGQSGGFLGRLLRPLLKTCLPLMKNVLKPLAKSVLIRLGLTVAASATHAAIYTKMFESGITTLIILNEEMNDIMKIVKSLEESGLLIKRVSETIENKVKERKGGFFSMLSGTLGVSLLGNLLTGEGTFGTSESTI